MILIGQFDSPFVRRTAIAMRLYGLDFEHRPWSVFGDAEKIARYNPLMRVPTLVLDDGEVLIESHAILDALDQMAGPGKAMMPAGEARRHALKVCALGTGIADKAVSMVYETHVHNRATPAWIDRCLSQIAA
jgi:glutathione S-transferase